MYKIKFKDFRCFGETPFIEIKPITFLVGENSVGKTSFLAGARYILESLSRRSQNPFNREPYLLGGFEQIAHYRGGRGGRAKSFTITLEDATSSKIDERLGKDANQIIATHSFTFTKGYPQPELSTYSFSLGHIAASFSFEKEIPELNIYRDGKIASASPLALKRSPPSSIIKSNNYYIMFLLEELRFSKSARTELNAGNLSLNKLGISESEFEQLWGAFRKSSRRLSQDVFASAPVRTQPLRTYTPSEILSSSEGSHVPLELAQTKQKSPEMWKNMKQELEKFGKNSGLFTEIEVRQLGKNDIDPFQILVKINGPAMNLVDVGYGVSQALPIVYQMQNVSRYGSFLLQQPEVHLHPRAQAEIGTLLSQMSNKKPRPTMMVETHSDYIIDRVRIEVANGTVNHNDITIVFFERDAQGSRILNLYLDESGEILNPPDGFRGFFLEEHAKLIGL